jgi:hypothetical protein
MPNSAPLDLAEEHQVNDGDSIVGTHMLGDDLRRGIR